jgi:hypothetical protein
MDERHKIDWGLQATKLLLQLENRQALPTNHPCSMAKLDEESRLLKNSSVPNARYLPTNAFDAASRPDKLGNFSGGAASGNL